jgi:O-antigen ligase
VLLGARHAPLPDDFLNRAGRAAVAAAVVVAGTSVFEALNSTAWNHFVINTLHYTRYQIDVLHGSPPNPGDVRLWGYIGGTKIIRTGSVFNSALTCGFYLVLGFALALERTARGRGGRLILPALTLIGAGLLLTQTRSAILAALVVAWFAFQPAAGRRRHWRTQMAIIVAALAIIAVPAAVSSGLTKRITQPTSTADNSGHISAFWNGMHTIEHHPFGLGLGTSAGVGQISRQTNGIVVPENNYLQVGVELGIVGGLAFLALTVALLLSLRRAARRRPDPAIAAAAAAMAGLAVAAYFLETWFDFAVAWTVWGFAGAALGAGRARAEQRQEAVAPPAHSVPQPLPA